MTTKLSGNDIIRKLKPGLGKYPIYEITLSAQFNELSTLTVVYAVTDDMLADLASDGIAQNEFETDKAEAEDKARFRLEAKLTGKHSPKPGYIDFLLEPITYARDEHELTMAVNDFNIAFAYDFAREVTWK